MAHTFLRRAHGLRRGLFAGLLSFALLAAIGGRAEAREAVTPENPTTFPTGSYAAKVGADAADVYYPATTSRGLPVALLLQGANVDKAHYEGFARTVAAFGFVVVVPNHVRPVFGVPGLWASSDQALGAVAWAAAENRRDGSPLAGRIDTDTLTLLGHSFGGAAGMSTIQGLCAPPFCAGLPPGAVKPAQLKAAAFFGTNSVPPGGGPVGPIDNAGVPVALIQGDADGVAAPVAARDTYRALSAKPKALVGLHGANHFGITDVQNPPGASPDASPQTLDQTEGIRAAGRWAALWLKASLGDPVAASYVRYWGDATDRTVTVEQAY
ncbi:alpha/beta hydrolase [Streptomyces flavidovirens]|uniref:poly(ethylene terephthalate) hydrolase family protein n=1 Tax=Streptomyces flavidovirens TaxID=67298 RepID=UPI0003F949F3|nr:alpha/beta hydrolase [Streptomyces flavidovirens]